MEYVKLILHANPIKSMWTTHANVEQDSSIFQEAVLNVKIISIIMEQHVLHVPMEVLLGMGLNVLVIMDSIIFLELAKDVLRMKLIVMLHKLVFVLLDFIESVGHVKDHQPTWHIMVQLLYVRQDFIIFLEDVLSVQVIRFIIKQLELVSVQLEQLWEMEDVKGIQLHPM